MKVFISYHRADTKYMTKVIDFLKDNEIAYYVVPKNHNFNGLYHQHIATIIIENMNSCDVLLCIVGKETYSRPHIDHELKAAFRGGVSSRKGIVYVMLENRQDCINNIDFSIFPNRLADNLEYCIGIQYSSFQSKLVESLMEAQKRSKQNFQINNSRELLQLRTGKYYDQ
jgi:hypothetical protein